MEGKHGDRMLDQVLKEQNQAFAEKPSLTEKIDDIVPERKPDDYTQERVELLWFDVRQLPLRFFLISSRSCSKTFSHFFQDGLS